MAESKQRPEALDIFNSLFGEDLAAEQENAPVSESLLPEEDKDFFKRLEESERSSGKDSDIPVRGAVSQAVSQPKEDYPEKTELDIDSMFESIKENVPAAEPADKPASHESGEKNPVSKKGVRSRTPARPIRKKVSPKAVEEILGGIISGGHKAKAGSAALILLGTGEVIELMRSPVIIGSSRTQADISLTGNQTISRRHALIEQKEGRYYISDMGSLNGTRLNGAILAPNHSYEINNGDKILISNEPFEFRTDI